MADAINTPTVATTSSEYDAMLPAWDLIGDILAGASVIRAKTEKYLPKYEDEGSEEYRRRVKTAPWRPEFADALRSLSAKPFGKEVALDDGAPDEIKTIAEDVDGRGNNITVFAYEAFSKAIANGLHAILVDYPAMQPGATLADQRAINARPYWVQIEAKNLIALYTAIVGGKEVVTHARIRECTIEREGFGEKTIERVRVLEPGIWQLWEEVKQTGYVDKKTYVMISEGVIDRGGNTEVPLVLFYTGERKGEMLVKPPLEDLAQMQIELYQALSRQDEVLTFAGSPMLAASGMHPPSAGDGKIAVGPKRVLFAPPSEGSQPNWSFIQPNAANIKEIRDHVASITEDMRRLGMQPITQPHGAPTATGQSIEAAKAHSAVTKWALGLKDALELAMVYTTQFLSIPDVVEVDVSTDFAVAPFAQAPLDALDKARARKDLSLHSYWQGLRRFDVLPSDFDPEAEELALAEEQQGLVPEVAIDPVTGKPIDQNADLNANQPPPSLN